MQFYDMIRSAGKEILDLRALCVFEVGPRKPWYSLETQKGSEN
jgi:hypothetical protein